MKAPHRILIASLLLMLAHLTGCLTEGDELDSDDTGLAEVTLTANNLASVATFNVMNRQLSSPQWITQSLQATVSGNQATASTVLVLPVGDFVFRGEALDSGGGLLGQPREVRVTVTPGANLTVTIALDIADFDEEGAGGRTDVSITAQNGAELEQSSISNTNPTASVSTTITIDAVSDFENNTIRTGFVVEGVLSTPEFFSGTSTAADFVLHPIAGTFRALAVAIDDSSAGTAHAYVFDTTANPTLQDVEIWRVNDVRAMNSADNNLIVFSMDGPNPATFAFGDFDGDTVVDNGLEAHGETLLSWGVSSTNPNEYVVRTVDSGGVIRIRTFNFDGSAAPIRTALE